MEHATVTMPVTMLDKHMETRFAAQYLCSLLEGRKSGLTEKQIAAIRNLTVLANSIGWQAAAT